jgi:hypothetical protein
MNVRLAALDFITGCLSVRNEPNHNDTLFSTIASGRLDWPTVILIANTELVTPAFWVALKDRQMTQYLPADVYDYLSELYRLNKTRNAHLRAQVIEVVYWLNTIDIEPLLLKGAVGLFVETFGDPGSRVMTDLDILVPEHAAQACWNTLCKIGYRPFEDRQDQRTTNPPISDWPAGYRQHQHLHPLHRPGEYGTVEIHRSALASHCSGSGLLPTQLLWRNTERIQASRAEMAVPTPTYRVLHNLVHSMITDRAYLRGRIPLRPLHETAQMQVNYRKSIDWENIQKRFASCSKSKVLQGFLYLSHKYFDTPLPDAIPRTAGSVIHHARARLLTRWEWPKDIIEPVLDFWATEVVERVNHLSAENICARYQCENDFLSITQGRMRLVLRRIRLTGAFVAKHTRRPFRGILER